MFSETFENTSTDRISGIARNLVSRLVVFARNRRTEISPRERAELALRREQMERAATARTDILLKVHQLGLGG